MIFQCISHTKLYKVELICEILAHGIFHFDQAKADPVNLKPLDQHPIIGIDSDVHRANYIEGFRAANWTL